MSGRGAFDSIVEPVCDIIGHILALLLRSRLTFIIYSPVCYKMSHIVVENMKRLQPEVDYQALMAQMPDQSHPRRKLKELQSKGCLIRLKKGFYVFTRDFIGRDYSDGIVANLLYGPSYLSLEYAMAFHGLIPERVEERTSVTSQKNKRFETPIGRYTYRHLHPSLYPLGVTLGKSADGRSFLIATPEKAVMDLFTLKFKGSSAPGASDIVPALVDDLRIDIAALRKKIDRPQLEQMRPHYRNRRWNRLVIDFLLETP